jgi:hypothetical protein
MIYIYDPLPSRNEYATFFLNAIAQYCSRLGVPIKRVTSLNDARGSAVLLLTDYLTDGLIIQLKDMGNKIVGFNVTDSSYISGAIRYSPVLHLMDIIYMVSGIPTTNYASEFSVSDDFNIVLSPRPFLDEKNWDVFNRLRQAGILKSLPYVPWHPIPEVKQVRFDQRSQKVIMRGGGHARRIVLALFLLQRGQLDTNSGFVLKDYFDGKNPFRYCEMCLTEFKQNGNRARYLPHRDATGCTWRGTYSS